MKYLNYYRIKKKKLDDETTKVLKLAFEKKIQKIYCHEDYNNIDDFKKSYK